MQTAQERDFFLQHGYLHVPGVVTGSHLSRLQEAFDHVWKVEKAPPCTQHELLKHEPFIQLIEHPPILDRHRAVFGSQVQLLQLDLLSQPPHSTAPPRQWHRDFMFPGDNPVSINTILFIDDITAEKGPTRVVPGSHRGRARPPADRLNEPLPGEVAVELRAGDAIFINSAIWHSGGRNASAGQRRGIYLYYGYWWLKRYNAEKQIPWQALRGATDQRLSLLGVRMPDADLHMYNPDSQ